MSYTNPYPRAVSYHSHNHGHYTSAPFNTGINVAVASCNPRKNGCTTRTRSKEARTLASVNGDISNGHLSGLLKSRGNSRKRTSQGSKASRRNQKCGASADSIIPSNPSSLQPNLELLNPRCSSNTGSHQEFSGRKKSQGLLSAEGDVREAVAKDQALAVAIQELREMELRFALAVKDQLIAVGNSQVPRNEWPFMQRATLRNYL